MAIVAAIRATYTCTRCMAREMSRDEYRAHMAVVHDMPMRLGKILAMMRVS